MKRRGYILSIGDLIRGFVYGTIVGAVVTFLIMKGIIPLPIPGIGGKA